MTAPYVPGCHHHAYFRFMAPVHPLNAKCRDRRPSDEVARHHLEDAIARGTAEPDGVTR
jgi:hypothetical protein